MEVNTSSNNFTVPNFSNISYLWTKEQKEEFGFQAKMVLEMGRVLELQKYGFEVNLHKYIDCSISPENLLIIGRRCEISENL